MSRFESSLYVLIEYILRNAGLEEAQARIKIAGGNISNLRYADVAAAAAAAKCFSRVRLCGTP